LLQDLFDGARSRDTPVALTGLGPATLGDLALAAGRVARQARPGRQVLACPDAFGFAAGLLGLLQARCTVLIPPNGLPETLAALALEAQGLVDRIPADGPPAPLGPVPDGDLEFWTSGSTGRPKRVVRRFSELAAEVRVLEALFGHHCRGGPILGTVPHHHIDGCLFRILWPLHAGRVFAGEVCGDPDRFASSLSQPLPPVLVSSPAHLSRLPHLVDLDRFRGAPSVIFSSGGPLPAEDAVLWRRWVPAGVVEIYGSTESGGIAWRAQDGGEAARAWTPFPDVGIATDADGALLLASPRVATGRLRMEDAVRTLPDGRFLLQGRLDRVVKIEEKRVSLPELEAALEAHPWVRRAAVLVLEGRRRTLGAALVLRPEAPPLPSRQRATALREHLARRFEAAALPRRWRFLPELPADARGKVDGRRLAERFQIPESP
jgi:acyl-coenzyme A synthetase/AMP-(fatty) acid ligase